MKKLFILIIVSFILLFSFSILASAESFPNSVVNLLNHKTFRSATLNGVNFQLSGNYYILNGIATTDIKFQITTCNLSNTSADQLYILYGGTDNSQVSLLCNAQSLDVRSSNIPSIFSLPRGGYNFISYIYVPKGTVLQNVKVKPIFAKFDFTVYDYGTNISNQTDIYYNDGYSVGYNEGITEGYNSGKAEGITEGYNSGKAEGYELGSLNGEKVGYIDGYKSGYTNYKLSTEYKSALENKYSSGFKEGAASVEQEETDMTLAILIPSIVIECILGIFLTVFLSRKKQRRKNK